jgi:hypothetical protein
MRAGAFGRQERAATLLMPRYVLCVHPPGPVQCVCRLFKRPHSLPPPVQVCSAERWNFDGLNPEQTAALTASFKTTCDHGLEWNEKRVSEIYKPVGAGMSARVCPLCGIGLPPRPETQVSPLISYVSCCLTSCRCMAAATNTGSWSSPATLCPWSMTTAGWTPCSSAGRMARCGLAHIIVKAPCTEGRVTKPFACPSFPRQAFERPLVCNPRGGKDGSKLVCTGPDFDVMPSTCVQARPKDQCFSGPWWWVVGAGAG